MKLHELQYTEGARKARKRVGRMTQFMKKVKQLAVFRLFIQLLRIYKNSSA